MEFRRINALPPYVFGIMDALKIEARRAGERRRRPRLRQPRHAVARRRRREARRGGRATRATTVTPRAGASRSCGWPIADLYQRKFGVELDPDTAGVQHHRRQGGLLAPHVGAARPRRRRARAEPVVPDPHLGPDPRRRRGAPRAPRARAGLLRQPARGVGGLVAAAARHRAVVPAQPDDRVRRPRLHAAHRRLRARARRAARARLRVRRPRLRRLRPAVDPAGARRQRRRGRALHADEVVLDGRVARRVPARQRRGGRRARPSSRATSTTARSSRSRSRRPSR